jgi:hypothetical protein
VEHSLFVFYLCLLRESNSSSSKKSKKNKKNKKTKMGTFIGHVGPGTGFLVAGIFLFLRALNTSFAQRMRTSTIWISFEAIVKLLGGYEERKKKRKLFSSFFSTCESQCIGSSGRVCGNAWLGTFTFSALHDDGDGDVDGND